MMLSGAAIAQAQHAAGEIIPTMAPADTPVGRGSQMRTHTRFFVALVAVTSWIATTSGCGPTSAGPGPGCHYKLSSAGRGVPQMGGGVQIRVEAPTGCTWTFQGNDPWITVATAPPAPSGDGNGTVAINVAGNTGMRRVGTANIAFQRVTIDQAGTDGAGSCTFQFFPLAVTVGPAGGAGAFVVLPSAPDCGWWVEAPSPDEDWLVEDFTQGIGTGVATYRIQPGSVPAGIPPPRTGRLGIHNSANALITNHMVTQMP